VKLQTSPSVKLNFKGAEQILRLEGGSETKADECKKKDLKKEENRTPMDDSPGQSPKKARSRPRI
jgi:hypothetical protein